MTFPLDDPERDFDVQQRILRHGRIPLGFLPGVTLEQLEAFADRLDAEAAAQNIPVDTQK